MELCFPRKLHADVKEVKCDDLFERGEQAWTGLKRDDGFRVQTIKSVECKSKALNTL